MKKKCSFLFVLFVILTPISGFSLKSYYGFDTLIVKKWKEHGVNYKVEITIKNAATSDGIIPGQQSQSFITVKKIQVKNNKEKGIFYAKDTCDAQMQQLVFYKDCMKFTDINKDGKMEVILLYEFGSDGFEDRKVHYALIENDKQLNLKLNLKYDEQKMKYLLVTSSKAFVSFLPAKFRSYGKSEFTRISRCLRP